MSINIGEAVEVKKIWAYGADPDWIGGYIVKSFPHAMPTMVKLMKTRGLFSGECILVALENVRSIH